MSASRTGLQNFKGFRGHAALCQIGDVQFVLLARNAEQLAALYAKFLPEAEPFNANGCQKSIIIQASLLPQPEEKE